MTSLQKLLLLCGIFSPYLSSVSAFSNHGQLTSMYTAQKTVPLRASQSNDNTEPELLDGLYEKAQSSRRHVISASLGMAAATAGTFLTPWPAQAEGEESESFASIAARANKISKEIDSTPSASTVRKTDKTMYDFDFPMEGTATPIKELIRQQFDASGNNAKVKAILVVNIKQDDPVARKDIPELISLSTK